MLPVNCRSWQPRFQSYQNSVTVGVDIPCDHSFQSYQNPKILSTVGVDVPFHRRFQSYQNPVNGESLLSCRTQFSELPKFCQVSELAFLSTIRIGKRSFKSYLKPARVQASRIRVKNLSFRSYPKKLNSMFPINCLS